MQFDFGKNWTNFSKKALDDRRIRQARTDFNQLLSGLNLADRSFVDIGFGQGLSLLLAKETGAQVVGCDINKNCLEALRQTSRFFPGMQVDDIPLVIGSILEIETVDRLETLSGHRQYDVVHSWGVLHHTGNMSRAIAHAARLVKPDGKLIIAIYNRHWSSPLWLMIKRLYCGSPNWVQRIMIGLFFPIICIAKFLVTGKNPLRQERGMDFFYDVIDWVGGYPYEYATQDEICAELTKLDFDCEQQIAATVPTGCNQFVFTRHHK